MEGKVYATIHGTKDPGSGVAGNFDFYQMFCGDGSGGVPVSRSAGNKPFFITETGATIHLAAQEKDDPTKWYRIEGGDPESRKVIKQSWLRQILGHDFLQSHPKIKGISTFEFIKFEESTWRDFTNFGKYSELSSVLGSDGGDLDGPTLEAIREDLMGGFGSRILWASGLPSKSDHLPSGTYNSEQSLTTLTPSLIALLVLLI